MDFTDLSVRERILVRNLFTAANYCFATVTANRSPTFYFAMGGLNCLNTAPLCGRLRTLHNNGPLIDITTETKGHIFFQKRVDQRAFTQRIRNAKPITRKHEINIALARHRATPVDGYFHYEYIADSQRPYRVARRHPSGGQVALNPRPSNLQVTRLIDRLLADNAAVRINHAGVHALGVAVPRPVITTVGAYLASL